MKSILVIGLGRFGRHMVAKLLEEGNSVLAIEKNEERADNALDIISDVQIADATNEMVIRSLGVSNFDQIWLQKYLRLYRTDTRDGDLRSRSSICMDRQKHR